MKIKTIISYALPILLAGALLFWALQQVSLQALAHTFARANYGWIFVSVGLGILSHYVRALRWRQLIAPIGYDLPPLRGFLSVMTGYFMNFVLPRAGELARCAQAQRLAGIPTDKALGTVVVERLIDVLMLGLLTLILLLVESGRLGKYFFDFISNKIPSANFLFLIIIFFIFGLIIFYVFYKKIKLLIIKKSKNTSNDSSVFSKIQKIFYNIQQGIMSISKIRRVDIFILYTIVIWGLYYLMGYVLFFCFPETTHFGLWFAYILLIMGAIGMATPVQGGFGAYHLLVGNIFGLVGLSAAEGIVLATFMHTIQTLTLLSVGGGAIIWSVLLRPLATKK